MVTLWCRLTVATFVVSGAALRRTKEKPQNGTGAPHGWALLMRAKRLISCNMGLNDDSRPWMSLEHGPIAGGAINETQPHPSLGNLTPSDHAAHLKKLRMVA
ncbi:MAG: hypothetical protein QNJ84_19300 [Alphaproteobacteria bacterium]|nr:hypothetical protein [Alphaproteobacteria bacterium]